MGWKIPRKLPKSLNLEENSLREKQQRTKRTRRDDNSRKNKVTKKITKVTRVLIKYFKNALPSSLMTNWFGPAMDREHCSKENASCTLVCTSLTSIEDRTTLTNTFLQNQLVNRIEPTTLYAINLSKLQLAR